MSVVLLSRLILNLRLENEIISGRDISMRETRMLFAPKRLGLPTVEIRDGSDREYVDEEQY